MTELVERYVHQVGRYLPPKERAEIEAELRSQIHDQLDDRYGESPSQADIAAVWAEFGHPHQMAASYNREQYLVGPDLYPYMMMVLRHGWLIVPTIAIFLNIFGALVSSWQGTLPDFFVETLIAILQATFIFSAVEVLIFAIIQRIGSEFDEKEEAFDPLRLPKVDDPHTVDRFEAETGIVIGALTTAVLLYFLRVGGLTLRFNLSDPGDVIPVPMVWLILMISAVVAMLILHMLVLRRNRWSAAMWLTETILEVFGMVCLYFTVYEPLLGRIVATVPSLAKVPVIDSIPESIVILTAVITLVARGSKLLGLLNYRNNSTPFLLVKRNR
jgi:hypothetical protein